MKSKKHVLIVNQHGENRGDESALRAMLDGIDTRLGGNVRFTVVVQFQDTSLQLPFDQDVELLHMKMPFFQYFRMILFSLMCIVKLPLQFLLSGNTKKIISAYKESDIVVSAPGGPYFGDIYAKHEIVHWYYVWLGLIFKKPLFLYAPSAGPFKNRFLNPIRKYFYPKFDVICLREEISRDYLENLIGLDKEIHVTADSAIQQVVPAMERSSYFIGENLKNRDKHLIAVSAIEYKFAGEPDPERKKQAYKQALSECLNFLSTQADCHFLLIPQLYGAVHSDLEYLNEIAQSLPENCTWEIVDTSLDSSAQRSIFAMSDLCIASRYHPQIFAGTSNVPGICIYYEHKAIGFMRFLDLEDFAFDIRNLDVMKMKSKLQEALDNSEHLEEKMRRNVIAVRERSAKTSDLLVEILG